MKMGKLNLSSVGKLVSQHTSGVKETAIDLDSTLKESSRLSHSGGFFIDSMNQRVHPYLDVPSAILNRRISLT